MLSLSRSVFALLALHAGAAAAAPNSKFDDSNFKQEDIINKEFVVVGCGAGGTKAAIAFKDAGKEVVVVEGRGRCGGHVQSYVDPATGVNINAAVQLLINDPVTQTFANRLGVKLAPASATLGDQHTNVWADFSTGKPVDIQLPGPEVLVPKLTKYIGLLKTKYAFLEQGYYLPPAIPDELAGTFGDFLIKNELTEILYPIYLYSQHGDDTKYPAVYALQQFDARWAQSLLVGHVAPPRMQDLYDSALKILGTGPDGVMLNTTIVQTERSDAGVKLIVKTQSGEKLIKAKKMLMSGYPLKSNLGGWDLSTEESALFDRWQTLGYIGGIIESKSLNTTPSYNNVSPNPPFFLPTFAGLYLFGAVPGHTDKFSFFLSSPKPIATDQGLAIVEEQIKRLDAAGIVDASDFNIVDKFNHFNYRLWVSEAEIKDHFYKKLYDLQGKHSTFYTGATFAAHDHAKIWAFSDRIVANMLS